MSLPQPIGAQRDVLCLPAQGHSVVLGTAGSGKTTLAILRAAYLADPGTGHCGKTLLVTFNRALVTYLAHLGSAELGNVRVENYHTFARGYLSARGKMGFNAILSDPTERIALIARAVAAVRRVDGANPLLGRPTEFLADEITWMLGHGIDAPADYADAERVGRTCRMERKHRGAMFDIFSHYLKLRAQTGKLYDWDDLATNALREFAADGTARLYRHVVIDEGQDFSPEMLRSLAAAIPPDGSLSFFGDMAQQIYGQRLSWRTAGLSVQKVWRFEHNYRNTAAIAAVGLAIAKMPYFSGVPDMVAPTLVTAAGPPPTLVHCVTESKEIALVLRVAKRECATKSVAILLKNREQEDLFTGSLPSGSVRLHRDMTTWQAGPGLRYGTYHAAKGLEFDLVIIPFLSAGNLPDAGDVQSFGPDDASTRNGKLLYVAATRAKKELLLTYTGTRTSLLPSNASLYKEVTG